MSTMMSSTGTCIFSTLLANGQTTGSCSNTMQQLALLARTWPSLLLVLPGGSILKWPANSPDFGFEILGKLVDTVCYTQHRQPL